MTTTATDPFTGNVMAHVLPLGVRRIHLEELFGTATSEPIDPGMREVEHGTEGRFSDSAFLPPVLAIEPLSTPHELVTSERDPKLVVPTPPTSAMLLPHDPLKLEVLASGLPARTRAPLRYFGHECI